MKNLPNLSDIIMSLGSGVDKLSGYSRNAFRPVLQNAFGDRSETDRPGVRQALSVFQAAHHAHLELDELRLGYVDWKILQPGEDWNMIKEVVKQVRLLEFNMSTGHDKATDEFGADIPERRQLISTGWLHELISGAATLEALSLCFDWNEPQSPAYFQDVFQDLTWSYLQITLEKIDASAQDWLDFFDRHSSTLRHVVMHTIRLTTGSWNEVLESMSGALNLDFAYLRGELLGEDPKQYWDLEPAPWAEYSDWRIRRTGHLKRSKTFWFTDMEDCAH